MRVAVIGSSGQLGRDLMAMGRQSRLDVIGLAHDEVDVTAPESIREALVRTNPQVVVNCAAYVRVDECEQSVEQAFAVNAVGAFHVARAAAVIGALCTYISTDYVFDGEKKQPYTEDDVPNPINVYGASKLTGEFLTKQGGGAWLIVRVSSLFGKGGARAKGGNFIDSILAKAAAGEELQVVDDLRISPTYTRHAAQALIQLISERSTGTLHLANSGATTWYKFAEAALRLAGLGQYQIKSISSHQVARRARRPLNSALSTRYVTGSTSGLPPWEAALEEYLRERNAVVETSSRNPPY